MVSLIHPIANALLYLIFTNSDTVISHPRCGRVEWSGVGQDRPLSEITFEETDDDDDDGLYRCIIAQTFREDEVLCGRTSADFIDLDFRSSTRPRIIIYFIGLSICQQNDVDHNDDDDDDEDLDATANRRVGERIKRSFPSSLSIFAY